MKLFIKNVFKRDQNAKISPEERSCHATWHVVKGRGRGRPPTFRGGATLLAMGAAAPTQN